MHKKVFHFCDIVYMMTNIFIVAGFTTTAWFIALGALTVLQRLPRIGFILAHYGVDVLVFGAVFLAYYHYFGQVTPFVAMAYAMITLFVLEFFFWQFVYVGEKTYLNFVDWVVPAFLIATTIYFVGKFAS